jgi:hypothetical protein
MQVNVYDEPLLSLRLMAKFILYLAWQLTFEALVMVHFLSESKSLVSSVNVDVAWPGPAAGRELH